MPDRVSPASFALEVPITDGDYVLRTGKVFEIGDYPDKNFALDANELTAAVASFKPVPVDLEHEQTVLDGKLGELRSVQIAEDGKSLLGVVALPKWLDTALGDGARKVSTTWNRASKQLEGLALVRNPRVADAAIFSAYAAFAKQHDTYEGQSALQDLHDTAARRGAVCAKPAEMASKHEASGIQQIHDTAVEHGARCSAIGDHRPLFSDTPNTSHKEKSRVNAIPEAVQAWFKSLLSDPAGETGAAAPKVEMSAEAKAELAAATQRAEAAETALAASREAGLVSAAAAFATKLVTDKRILPAQSEAVTALHLQTAKDDSTHGAVKFSDAETSRLAQLEAIFSALPQHGIATPSERVTIVANKQESDAATTGKPVRMSADRRRELLSKTVEGKAILAAEDAARSAK